MHGLFVDCKVRPLWRWRVGNDGVAMRQLAGLDGALNMRKGIPEIALTRARALE